MLDVLESVKQSNEPRSLDSSQDIPLYQNMLDLIHLCQCSLSHLLESTYFPRINLAGEVDGSITSLTDLSNNPELVYSELGSSFSE
jgi:hypothetical protein